MGNWRLIGMDDLFQFATVLGLQYWGAPAGMAFLALIMFTTLKATREEVERTGRKFTEAEASGWFFISVFAFLVFGAVWLLTSSN
jgi:hypothetical protein